VWEVALCSFAEALAIFWLVQSRSFRERDGFYMALFAILFFPLLILLSPATGIQAALPLGLQWAMEGICIGLMVVSTILFIVRHPGLR
jgi:hypothetical protein